MITPYRVVNPTVVSSPVVTLTDPCINSLSRREDGLRWKTHTPAHVKHVPHTPSPTHLRTPSPPQHTNTRIHLVLVNGGQIVFLRRVEIVHTYLITVLYIKRYRGQILFTGLSTSTLTFTDSANNYFTVSMDGILYKENIKRWVYLWHTNATAVESAIFSIFYHTVKNTSSKRHG